jgi:hypothetical protein
MLLRMVLMLIALAYGASRQTIADGLNPDSAIYQQIKALDDRVFQEAGRSLSLDARHQLRSFVGSRAQSLQALSRHSACNS